MANVVEALVPGGKANPGPPLGPALGPLGINVKAVIEKINEKTRDYNGMQVPIKVIVAADKSFEIEVGTPPTAALILKELGLEKGSGASGSVMVGDLKIPQAAKIARMKKDDVLAYTLKAAVKEVLGACVPMGVTAEGMHAKECQKAIDEGKFDEVLAGESW
ncbi:MAG: 50S ribosomal protein L11 [Methanolobus sp.]|jgi:large subunit ribosomal protein L11|uniref:50S ribosomal protein L11 n=1 Tax=Methanolobus sp. TaxID=1874737 RepID=UPI0027313529|nr:50S ribosomal protein L11 [Methanolobus sp.]MDP2216208.1 50S ribosomal protein L11 [Methanolobus sp.]